MPFENPNPNGFCYFYSLLIYLELFSNRVKMNQNIYKYGKFSLSICDKLLSVCHELDTDIVYRDLSQINSVIC